MIKGFSSGSAAPKGVAMDTLIGRQTEIIGDVNFSGGLHVDGRIKGNVSSAPRRGGRDPAEPGPVFVDAEATDDDDEPGGKSSAAASPERPDPTEVVGPQPLQDVGVPIHDLVVPTAKSAGDAEQ